MLNTRKEKLLSKVLAAFLIFAVLNFTACVSVKPIYFEDDKKVAQSQIVKFHQLFNDEKYSEMYDSFSDRTRNEISLEKFSESFKKLRKDAGKVKQSKLTKSEIKVEASIRVVELVYETEFENESLREKFHCLVDGKTAHIDIYDNPIPVTKD